MASVQSVNPNAMVMGGTQALMVNVSAAVGLQNVLKTNLGPKGTLKMLVGGAGQIKLTKDGGALLDEMQIQHPTAIMIARTAAAQDTMTGDGTTSSVLFTGELLKMAQRALEEGCHPRVITDGFEIAKDEALDFLDKYKLSNDDIAADRDLLIQLASTSLRTKLAKDMADQLTQIVTDAVLCVHDKEAEVPLDLHMVEVMHMIHKSDSDTMLIRGLLMDHGSRHPDMPKMLENCHILTCNVSMEYEKTEVSSSFVYKNAEERERMVSAERKFTDDKVRQVIALKKEVCKDGSTFVVINQKGIDPLSLDLLAKEGIIALRRAKRRNMERLQLCCGGKALNSFDNMTKDCLGWAGKVYEQVLGEDKYTFVEDPKNPRSCTICVKGPNQHTIAQIKNAVRDGLRNIKNAIEDGAVVAGGGAFEVACSTHLEKFADSVKGKTKLGVKAFAQALLVVPKVLAENSGFDVMDTLLAIKDEARESTDPVGLDVETGEPSNPVANGILDNLIVKRSFLHLSTVLATQLLLVDEVIKAGRNMGKK